MRKNLFYSVAILLVAMVATISCSKESSELENQVNGNGYKYMVSIPAEKKSTKVVADGGTATFKTTENIYICNTSNNNTIDAGVLHPNANAATAQFEGILTSNYSVGNYLKVLYNTTSEGIADYSSQDGTLQGVIDAGATTVRVKEVSAADGTIRTTRANIENLQSIFKFTFKSEGTTLNVKSVTITSEGNKLQQSYNVVSGTPVYGSVSLSNTTAQSTVYGALRFTQTASDHIIFTLEDENGVTYSGTKNAPSAGFVNGKFYTSTINVVEVPPFYYYGTANCLLLANNATSGTLNVAPYVTDSTFAYNKGVRTAGPYATKAAIIWEEQIGLISSASVSSDHTTMTVNRAAGQYGNALIGIYDDSDNLLWSFHIWCPEDNPTTLAYTQTNSGETYNLMNMPIGATKALTLSSSDDDKVKGFGLYYQWGRKDPLGRANAIGTNVIKPVYDKNGNAITLTAAPYIQNIENALAGYTDEATDGPMSHFMARYAIANPAVFLLDNNGKYSNNWSREINDYFWGNSYPMGSYPTLNQTYKSIFDPSPAGYRVAPQDTWVNFTTTRASSNDKTTFNVVGNESFDGNGVFNRGFEFYYQGLGTGLTHFYGASGFRSSASGALFSVGTYGYSCSSAPSGVSASSLNFYASIVSPLFSTNRAGGFPVRCVKE